MTPEQKIQILTAQRNAAVAEVQARDSQRQFEQLMSVYRQVKESVEKQIGASFNEQTLEVIGAEGATQDPPSAA